MKSIEYFNEKKQIIKIRMAKNNILGKEIVNSLILEELDLTKKNCDRFFFIINLSINYREEGHRR